MDEKLKVMSGLVVARALKEFAIRLGMQPRLAEVVAQAQMKDSPILNHWPQFLEVNCLRCSHDPEGCEFFYPKTCVAGATPASTRQANIDVVEGGSLKRCPCFQAG